MAAANSEATPPSAETAPTSLPPPIERDVVAKQTIPVTDLAVTDDESGWRGKDQTRIDVLKQDFRDGKFGLNIMTTISVLKDKTLEQKFIIDDGLSTSWALTELHEEFQADKDKQPSGGERTICRGCVS